MTSVTRAGSIARRLLPFALAFLTVAGVTAAAFAGGGATRAQVEDPNDTRGLLDVRRVWFEPEAAPPRWTVVTFSPWTEELTRDRGYVFVYLDTMGDERFDFYALIRSNGRRLSGSLWRDPKKGSDVRISALDVKRDSDLNVAAADPARAAGHRRVPLRVSLDRGLHVHRTCVSRDVRRPRAGRRHVRISDRIADADADADADHDTDDDPHGDADPVAERAPDRRLTVRGRSRRAAYHLRGDVAQLVEHRLCKAGVAGSNPVVSTLDRHGYRVRAGERPRLWGSIHVEVQIRRRLR